MSRLIIFTAAWSELEAAGVYPTFPDGGSSNILSQRLDYSEGGPPAVGERLLEYRDNGHLQPSSYRFSPWQVAKVEEFPGATRLEFVEEIVVASCCYAPLSEEENPWHTAQLGHTTLESFGGDSAAYTQFTAAPQEVAV